MEIDVKICGLKTRKAVDCAIQAGADMLGFVFFPKSPRHISIEEAGSLVGGIDAPVIKVGLMVDPTDKDVENILADVPLDMIQLHGGEAPERVQVIKAVSGLPVMKALSVAGPEDIEKAAAYEGIVDRFLFDAKPPKDMKNALPGGNAVSFDWLLMKGYKGQVPWMLAGGLTPENVAEAIKISGAPAVDVSSGVESSPGDKDLKKIEAFVKAAKGL